MKISLRSVLVGVSLLAIALAFAVYAADQVTKSSVTFTSICVEDSNAIICFAEGAEPEVPKNPQQSRFEKKDLAAIFESTGFCTYDFEILPLEEMPDVATASATSKLYRYCAKRTPTVDRTTQFALLPSAADFELLVKTGTEYQMDLDAPLPVLNFVQLGYASDHNETPTYQEIECTVWLVPRFKE